MLLLSTISEAIAEPDQFLGNITENVATSGPVETVIMELQMYLVCNSIYTILKLKIAREGARP
jgi:hypothetical protein